MAAKNSTQKKLEKGYDKIVPNRNSEPASIPTQQWMAPGDFFQKFSLYRETSSGLTSANTSFRER